MANITYANKDKTAPIGTAPRTWRDEDANEVKNVVNNFRASLDAGGKVPVAELPDAALKIRDSTDFNDAGLADGFIIYWDQTAGTFKPKAESGGISDVDINGNTDVFLFDKTTDAGTITLLIGLNDQLEKTVLAAPEVGTGTPTFRRLKVADIEGLEPYLLGKFVKYDADDQGLDVTERQNARTNIQAVSKDTDDTRTGGLTNEGKVTVNLDEASAALPIVEIKQQGVSKHVFTGDEARILPKLLRVNSPVSATDEGAAFRGGTNGGDPIFQIQNLAGTNIFYPRGTGGIGQLRSNASDESIRRDENYLTFPATVAGNGKLNDVALADGVGMVKFAATVTEVSGIVSNNSDQKELLVWTDNTDGITLTEQDTDSVAANRFLRQINVPYRTPVRIVYESSTGRWVNGNTGELQETDARYFEVVDDVLTLKYILPDIAALQAFVRGPAVLAYVSDPLRGGNFNYVSEADFVGSPDFGISFPAQDGGYWVRDFEGYVDPAWYGLVDGLLTDQSTIVQAVFTAEPKKVLFRKGIYYFNDISISSDCEIDFSGSEIFINDAGGILFTCTADGITFKNGIINGDSIGKDGIKINTNLESFSCENITIKNLIGTELSNAVGIRTDPGVKKIFILKCNFIDFFAEEDGVIANNIGANRAIFLDTPQSALIDNCFFDGIRGFEDGDCIHISSDVPHSFDAEVNIQNCRFENIYKRGIKLQASGVKVQNCKLYSNAVGSTITTATLIEIFGDNVVVSDCELKSLRAIAGITIKGKNTKIIGCDIENDIAKTYATANGSAENGILIDGSTAENNIITGCTVSSNVYGIRPTIGRTLIIGNFLGASNTVPILLLNANESNIVGNIFDYDAVIGRTGGNLVVSNSTECFISSNSFFGGADAIRLQNNASNTKFSNNYLNGLVINTASMTSDPDLVIDQDSNTYKYGFSAPDSGTWKRGDMIFYKTPSEKSNVGWVCVSSGTPGTWEPYGYVGPYESEWIGVDDFDLSPAPTVSFEKYNLFSDGSFIDSPDDARVWNIKRVVYSDVTGAVDIAIDRQATGDFFTRTYSAGAWSSWKNLNKEAAASADTAGAVGATYSQAEVQAILDELRDLKTKMRTAGLLAT